MKRLMINAVTPNAENEYDRNHQTNRNALDAPALVLVAGGFVCDGSNRSRHHAFLIAGGIALAIGIGRRADDDLPLTIGKSTSLGDVETVCDTIVSQVGR